MEVITDSFEIKCLYIHVLSLGIISFRFSQETVCSYTVSFPNFVAERKKNILVWTILFFQGPDFLNDPLYVRNVKYHVDSNLLCKILNPRLDHFFSTLPICFKSLILHKNEFLNKGYAMI